MGFFFNNIIIIKRQTIASRETAFCYYSVNLRLYIIFGWVYRVYRFLCLIDNLKLKHYDFIPISQAFLWIDHHQLRLL